MLHLFSSPQSGKKRLLKAARIQLLSFGHGRSNLHRSAHYAQNHYPFCPERSESGPVAGEVGVDRQRSSLAFKVAGPNQPVAR